MRTDDQLLRFHAVFQRTGPLLELGDTAAITALLDDAGNARALGQPQSSGWSSSRARARA